MRNQPEEPAEDSPEGDSPEQRAVDRLVGSYIKGEAARAEADDLVARVRKDRKAAKQADKAISKDGTRSLFPIRRTVAWFSGIAAVVAAAVFGSRILDPRVATAATLLRDAQRSHQAPVDRCYQVQYSPDARAWDGKNKLEGPSHSVLWTRGSQFWSDCTLGDLRMAIGREPDGGLWLSTSKEKGVRFTNDDSQLPPEVAFLCAVNSMSIPKLIDDVLADFELQVERPPLGEEGATLVWATLRSGRSHPLLSDAMLEIDLEQRVLTRLVLWTEKDGKPKGTVTFTLVGSSPQADQVYLLASHVAVDARIEIHTLKKK